MPWRANAATGAFYSYTTCSCKQLTGDARQGQPGSGLPCPVTAPSEAELTSAAYLRSTPGRAVVTGARHRARRACQSASLIAALIVRSTALIVSWSPFSSAPGAFARAVMTNQLCPVVRIARLSRGVG